jgi:hypothetical protein
MIDKQIHVMTKTEVKEIIDSEMKKFISDLLDKEMKKILHNSNSTSRTEIINMIKNSMEAVYKVLWYKKDFWKSDIK